MGRDELSKRDNWQTSSGEKALSLEKNFYLCFENYFKKNNKYKIREKPKEFKDIYNNIPIDDITQKEIFAPNRKYTHGISVDFAIDNLKTNKTIYIEIKRQDGWVANLPSSAGRGNAHERLCKLFTPGLLEILRIKSKIKPTHLPFCVVFGGNITRDPKRVREITCWFKGFDNHFFMWRDLNSDSIIKHFNNNLLPIIS